MQINLKKYIFVAAFISLATCLPAANAQTDGAHAIDDADRSRGLTPQTMLDQGFSFKCEFTENDKTNDVSVQIRFDPDKGPEIEEAQGAILVISQGAKTLVQVPIEVKFNYDTGIIERLGFSVDKELLADTRIYLDCIQGIHAYNRIIFIRDFYDTRNK